MCVLTIFTEAINVCFNYLHRGYNVCFNYLQYDMPMNYNVKHLFPLFPTVASLLRPVKVPGLVWHTMGEATDKQDQRGAQVLLPCR